MAPKKKTDDAKVKTDESNPPKKEKKPAAAASEAAKSDDLPAKKKKKVPEEADTAADAPKKKKKAAANEDVADAPLKKKKSTTTAADEATAAPSPKKKGNQPENEEVAESPKKKKKAIAADAEGAESPKKRKKSGTDEGLAVDSPKKKGTKKGEGASPMARKQSINETDASSPRRKSSVGGKQAGLFKIFEQLILLPNVESTARDELLDLEQFDGAGIRLQELTEHCELSEGTARQALYFSEDALLRHLQFEYTTEIKRLLSEQESKKKNSHRALPSMDARIRRKKARLDAELAAEEERLTKDLQGGTGATEGTRQLIRDERERRLREIEHVRDELDRVVAEAKIFDINHNKKLETKRDADQRKSMNDKKEHLTARLQKLEELDHRQTQREEEENRRKKRIASLAVDVDIINGEKNIQKKIVKASVEQKQADYDDLLDESMFRQMMVRTGDQYYEKLKTHQAAVDKFVGGLEALHKKSAPIPLPPKKAPPKLKELSPKNRRDSASLTETEGADPSTAVDGEREVVSAPATTGPPAPIRRRPKKKPAPVPEVVFEPTPPKKKDTFVGLPSRQKRPVEESAQ